MRPGTDRARPLAALDRDVQGQQLAQRVFHGHVPRPAVRCVVVECRVGVREPRRARVIEAWSGCGSRASSLRPRHTEPGAAASCGSARRAAPPTRAGSASGPADLPAAGPPRQWRRPEGRPRSRRRARRATAPVGAAVQDAEDGVVLAGDDDELMAGADAGVEADEESVLRHACRHLRFRKSSRRLRSRRASRASGRGRTAFRTDRPRPSRVRSQCSIFLRHVRCGVFGAVRWRPDGRSGRARGCDGAQSSPKRSRRPRIGPSYKGKMRRSERRARAGAWPAGPDRDRWERSEPVSRCRPKEPGRTTNASVRGARHAPDPTRAPSSPRAPSPRACASGTSPARSAARTRSCGPNGR